MHEATLHTYRTTPNAELHVSLNPDEAEPLSQGKLVHGDGNVILENHSEWPLVTTIAAGLYMLSIDASGPFQNKSAILNVTPPLYEEAVDMS